MKAIVRHREEERPLVAELLADIDNASAADEDEDDLAGLFDELKRTLCFAAYFLQPFSDRQ